ncbi:MAG: alpha/beta hydrolase [Anaerolineales bacterium]|nr:MAG: alpha/beta hydrolase [Anaerolineales bacterium]
MSLIVTDQGEVHYETHGRGDPVILLHGWLESWDHWTGLMEALGDDHKTYALDFWGFGESGKHHSAFAVPDYVGMVDQFMERLGIQSASVVGHSMGGTVSLSLALDHPGRVNSVVVVGSPIVGDGLALILRLAANRPLAGLAWATPGSILLLAKLVSPLLARDRDAWYHMFERDLGWATSESFHRSVASLRATDLRPRLSTIRARTLGVYGRRDRIVSPRQGDLLRRHLSTADVRYFDRSGHFPMLDEPRRFYDTVRAFLAAAPQPASSQPPEATT